MRSFTSRVVIVFVALVLDFGAAGPAAAAPEGTMTWGVHVTLASRWLDPGETEGIATPFMVLYALLDALVKPMPQSFGQTDSSFRSSRYSSSAAPPSAPRPDSRAVRAIHALGFR